MSRIMRNSLDSDGFRQSLIYHKTRSEGSGFGIMFIVTFPTIQKISCDWYVVNGGEQYITSSQ